MSNKHSTNDIPRDIRALVEGLQADNILERLSALNALASMGAKARPAIPKLFELVEGKLSDFRLQILMILLKLHAPEAITLLVDLMKDSSTSYLHGVFKTAVSSGNPQALDSVAARLADSNPDIRQLACLGLKRSRSTRVIMPLLIALTDQNRRVRASAAHALCRRSDPSIVKPLLFALDDEDCWVRSRAAEALGWVGDSRAVLPLIDLLRDEEGRVRWSAVWALGESGDYRAVEPLICILWDEERMVRRKASQKLRKLTGKTFGENPTQWNDWWKSQTN